MMRLFVAVSIPENVRKTLYAEAAQLQKEGLFEGKITERENIHLTLKFLGEIEENKLEIIIERLKEIKEKKIEAILGGFGVFDEKFVRIIWARLLGVDNIQKKVDRSLKGLFKDEERFMSHITIARVKNVKEKRSLIDRLKKIRLDNIKFKIESFELMKSELSREGARYEVVEKFELI